MNDLAPKKDVHGKNRVSHLSSGPDTRQQLKLCENHNLFWLLSLWRNQARTLTSQWDSNDYNAHPVIYGEVMVSGQLASWLCQ